MEYKKIYEFLVWDNCNNKCKFCWQREKPRLYNPVQRKMILDEVIDFIGSDKFEEGSHILVCGGEIFDKPQDFLKLGAFFRQIAEFMTLGVVDLLYINTNLIYVNMLGVNELLEILENNNLLDRLRFTTSYDIAGRFKNELDREEMLFNLKSISLRYPTIHIVANTILTKPACEAILNNEYRLDKFMKEYNCWVNLIPYIVLDDELTADRKMIFDTLRHVDKQCPGYLKKYVPNMSITQEKWLYMYKDNEFQFCSCPMSDCGHSVNFKKYSKEGTCFCCDIEEVFNAVI